MTIDSILRITETELEIFKTDIEQVKKSLTLPNPEYANSVRFGKGRFYRKIPKELCYLEKDSRGNLLLPRYIFGEPTPFDSDTIDGRRGDYESKIVLRDYQEKFLKDNQTVFMGNTGIVVEMPCGHGKTVFSIHLTILRGKVQTLVVVPTYYLAKQWKQSIERVTTATTFIVTSTDTDIPLTTDFTIIVADLFTVRELPLTFIKNVGQVILDEAHRMGADTYLPILKQLPATYRTALTATFRRNDGVHRILKFHFGEHVKLTNQFPPPEIYALRTGVEVRGVLSKNSRKCENTVEYMLSKDVPFHETKDVIEMYTGFRPLVEKDLEDKRITKKLYLELVGNIAAASKLPYTTIDSYLNQHSGRRKLVIKLIQESLDAGRTILFLSKRKDVLKSLHKYFREYRPMLVISETAKLSPREEDFLQNKCRLVFGVTQLAKEGLDIDRLDTLIIHLPMADTEQAVGRIARLHPSKKSPKAFYLLDYNPVLFSTFTKAKKTFHINGEYKGEIRLSNLDDLELSK